MHITEPVTLTSGLVTARLSVSRRALLQAAVLIALCLLPIALWAPFFNAPLMNDEGIFSTIARRMLAGGLPYRDLFDIAPPLIYGWYALSFLLFGYETWAPRVMTAIVLSLTVPLIYIQGRLLLSQRAAYVAAFVFALSTGLAQLGMWALHEYFVLLPLTAALVTFTLGWQGRGRGWYLAAGILGGLSIVTNQLTAFHLLALLFLSFKRTSPDPERGGRRWIPPILMLAGVSSVLLLMVIPYLIAGAFGYLFYAFVEFPIRYASAVPWQTRLNLAFFRTLWFIMAAGPLVIMSIIGLAMVVRHRGQRRPLLVAWTVASLAALSGTGRLHIQYFVGLLPAMALLTAYAVDAPKPYWRKQWVRGAIYLALLASGFVAFTANANIYLQPTAAERHVRKLGEAHRGREVESPLLAAYIRERTQPGDLIYNLGHQGELYFEADRLPPTRFFQEFAIRDDPNAMKTALADLERDKPVYFIDSVWGEYMDGLTGRYYWQFLPFLTRYYDYEGQIYYADVYRLKDESRQTR